jgi:hypothetical protein
MFLEDVLTDAQVSSTTTASPTTSIAMAPK